MSELREKLIKEFHDPEYRHVYCNGFLDTLIATQIQVLRQQRRWKQEELGAKIGTTQSGVSRLENPEEPSWTITTLRKVAEAFDLALIVKFVSFGEALNEIESFGRLTLERPSFEDDASFREVRQADAGTVGFGTVGRARSVASSGTTPSRRAVWGGWTDPLSMASASTGVIRND